MPAETHSHGAPEAPHDIAVLVIERLSELLDCDVDEIRPEARLREDLDADDLVVLDLFDVIEDELGERTVGFRLDDDDLVDLVTVADIIEYVTNIVGQARP